MVRFKARLRAPYRLSPTLAWRFPTLAVCAGKVRLACPLTDQGPRDGPA